MKKGIIIILLIFIIPLALASLEILGNDAENKKIELTARQQRVTTFLHLTDTPSSYSSQGGNCVKVNLGETALEFGSCGTPGSGDIESVQGDIYITNGSNSGAVNLVFNETQLISRGNLFGWNSTFNSTYNNFAYNQTIPANSYTDSQVNKTFNQSLTDSLYASIIWGYNQTIPAITDINNRFWNRTQSYNKTEIDSNNASWSTTFNSTYHATTQDVNSNRSAWFTTFNSTYDSTTQDVNANRSAWFTTFNSTYNNILNQQCPANQYAYFIQSNGTILCREDQTGGGNPFDQVLNTTSNVIFNNVNATKFFGLFNWTTGDIYTLFNGAVLTLTSSATQWFYNQTTPAISYTDTVVSNNNASWSTTFNSTYSNFAYNQTIPANSYTDSIVSSNNASWSTTFNSTYHATTQDVNSNRSAWFTTFNSTYDAKVSFNNTNLAYLNNTQNFTVPQNFNSNITQVNVRTYWNGSCQITQHLVSGTKDIIC